MTNKLSISWQVRSIINAQLQREWGKSKQAQFCAFSIMNAAIKQMKQTGSTTAVVVPWDCHIKEDAWGRKDIPNAIELLKNTDWLLVVGNEDELEVGLSQKYIQTIEKFNKGQIKTLGLEQDNVYSNRKGIVQANGRDWVDTTAVDSKELKSRLKKLGKRINENRRKRS